MDGPGTTGFSGGGEIASAFVTIGADLSGLRAAEQESRQITDRIGQMTANVGFGGGTVGAPSGGTSLFTGGSVSHSPSFGTTGGAFAGAAGFAGVGGTTRIDIDTSGASQSVQRLASDVRALKEQLDMLNAAKEGFVSRGAAVPGDIASAISSIESQMGAGAPGGASGSTPSFGGSGFGRARSPLSIYGAAYRLGIGIGSMVAADEAVRLGSTVASGYDIASHPEYILNDVAGPMDALGLAYNPAVRGQTASLAEIRGSQKVVAGAESIPLLGSLVQFGDAIAGGSTRLAESENTANRNIAVSRTLAEMGLHNQLSAAELTGDPVERLRVQASQQEQPYRQLTGQLPALQSRAAAEIAQQLQELRRTSPGTGGAGAYNVTASTIEQLDPELASQIANAKQAASVLGEMSANNQGNIALASRAHEGELSLMQNYGETAMLRGQATATLMARNPDSERQAMALRQKAEYQDFAAAAATRFDAEKDPRKQWAIQQQTVGARSELESQQSKERADLERQIAGNVAQASAEGGETILRAHREFYAADLKELEEYARKRRDAVKGKSPEEQMAAETDISQRGAALAYNADFAWSQSSIIAGGQIAAAGYRASRNPYQANLANFNAGFTASLGNIDLTSPHGIAQFGQSAQVHFAELRAMGIGRAQDLQLEREGYQGETTVANDLSADKPITAQADSAIARARRMVETASPEARPAAVTAGQAMLRAQIHELTAQRGGETAIDMSYGQAIGSMYGSGIDLTGRIGDINNARKNLNQADSDLPNAKLTDSIDPATAKAFMDSVVSVLQVIAGKSGAALFN